MANTRPGALVSWPRSNCLWPLRSDKHLLRASKHLLKERVISACLSFAPLAAALQCLFCISYPTLPRAVHSGPHRALPLPSSAHRRPPPPLCVLRLANGKKGRWLRELAPPLPLCRWPNGGPRLQLAPPFRTKRGERRPGFTSFSRRRTGMPSHCLNR